MHYAIMFYLFVTVIGLILLSTAYVAHFTTSRHGSAWWAGVILSCIWLASASSSFQPLPRISRTSNDIDWQSIYQHSIQLDWISLAVGILLSFLILEILYRIETPEHVVEFNRVVALIILLLAFASLSLTFYIFFFRRFNYVYFSGLLGMIEGILLYVAFRGRSIIRKIFYGDKLAQ